MTLGIFAALAGLIGYYVFSYELATLVHDLKYRWVQWRCRKQYAKLVAEHPEIFPGETTEPVDPACRTRVSDSFIEALRSAGAREELIQQLQQQSRSIRGERNDND